MSKYKADFRPNDGRLIHTEKQFINRFVYDEIYQELRQKKLIEIQGFANLPLDVMNFKNSSFSLVNDDMLLSYINAVGFKTYGTIVDTGNYVCFTFTHSGSRLVELRDKMAESPTGDLIILINVARLNMLCVASSFEKCISIKVLPQALIEKYGLNVDGMPEHLRSSLLGKAHVPAMVRVNLSPRSRAALNTIFSCEMGSPLFMRFMHAKAEELTCEIVYELNKMYSGGIIHFGLSRSEKDMQLIEAAAHIYDQSIGHAPSVDTLSRNLGIDKNKLTAGFKDRFGCSPAEYGRTQALEWARSQLIKATHSVQSVAAMCGYSTTSAFTRAFAAYFGKTPSSMRREQSE